MRILVVEDDPGARAVIESVLSKDLDARVETVELGERAIDLLARESYDVVVLDHHLPDTTGLTVLEHVQRVRPETVVIYLTGVGDEEIAQQALAQGAVNYLTKGLDTYQSLPMLVHDAFQRWEGQRPVVDQSDLQAHAEKQGPAVERSFDDRVADSRLKDLIVCSPEAEVLYSTLGHDHTNAMLAGDVTTWLRTAEVVAEDAGLELGTMFGTLQGEPGTIALLAAPETVVLVGIYDRSVDPDGALDDLRTLLEELRDHPSAAPGKPDPAEAHAGSAGDLGIQGGPRGAGRTRET